MLRRRSFAALSICLASLLTTHARAQALADHVPGDALFYFGWQGADAVGAASKETRLANVLAESRVHELFGSYLDAAEAKLVAKEPQAREPMRLLRALGAPAWRKPTALFVGTSVEQGGAMRPRFAILTQAGPDAERLATELKALVARAPRSETKIDATSAGDVVCFSVGYDDPTQAVASGDALSKDPGFAAAAKRVTPSPAYLWYVNAEGAIAAVEREAARSNPEQAKKVAAFLDASGLRGVKRYVSASGFEGKDWATQSFLEAPAPRTGLLASAAGPIDAALLKIVPADATLFTSARVDVAQGVRDVQAALGKTDPEALKNFNMVLGAAHQVAGTSVLTNLLDPLGTDWVAYNSPSVNSSGLLGVVLVNKPDDAAKLKKALATASLNLTNWINIAIAKNQRDGAEPPVTIHGATTKIGNVEVYYLATPLFAPSWAIHDGRLFLGLYPQSVGAAARHVGPSLVEGEKYKAAIARLKVGAPIATSFADLPALAGNGTWFSNLLLIGRYAGIGDLFGLTLPEPFLPPFDTLMANLAPTVGATWADDAGLYSKSIVPFPGAKMLSEQGMFSAGGIGGVATATSILLPSLNRARETANRVKSASNLRQIGMACLLFSNENRNRYPDDIETLLRTQDLVADVFISPRTGTEIPADFAGDPAARNAFVAREGDYVYLGKGLRNDAAAETIVAYEDPEGLEDGINVLYGDGHVDFVMMEPALAEIAKQKAARGIE